MRLSILAVVLGLAVGCAHGTVPPPNAAHPASEHAPEGTAYVARASSAPASTSSSDHAGHHHGAAPAASTEAGEKVTYTCPMHPEVVSDKPGSCPKCGMTLVPKKKE